MPTASAAKLEKQGSLDANDPLKQGIVMVEHKIRNLEKRKLKLDGYRDLQKSGKDLNTDQLDAISKYDAVIQHLDFAKELSKHLSSLATDAVKNAKKQARKEAQEKAQQDLQRFKEMLMIQDVLSSMGQDAVRDDFLQGKAKITLTPEELQHIDDLYIELTPKREEHKHFQDMFQGPAEVMTSLLEGKNKEISGTTYAVLKAKLLEIANCGYFNSAAPEPEPVAVEEAVQEVPVAPVAVAPPPVEQPAPINAFQGGNQINEVPVPAPLAHVSVPPTHVPLPQQPVVPIPVHQPAVVPQPEEIRNPPSAIETTYFTPSHLKVFKSGTIDFMQDNELDTPEHNEAAPSIPTMTYTNQSYTPSQTYEPVTPAQVVAPSQPETQVYHNINNTVEEDQGWSHVGNDVHPPVAPQPLENNDGWEEEPGVGGGGGGVVEDSWASQSDTQWSQPQHNDGFITQGGRPGGRGGRGRGGGDRGDRSQKSGNYSGRPGGRGGRGGYNNREGGGYNREGGGYNREASGYNREGGGGGSGYREGGYGNYKEQNNYQNGFQNRTERGGRGRGGGLSGDRQGGGRGRGGGRGGYRGGNQGGGYRPQPPQPPQI